MGKIAHLGVIALLLCAGASVAQRRTPHGWWVDAPRPRGDEMMRETLLAGHNAARAEVGMPPLAWSDALAADAARYAAELARTDRFAHSPHPRGDPAQGENLWMGTHGAYRYAEMAASWTDEGHLFRDRPTPDFSASGRWEDVAHYTQVIWGRTTTVGCAFAANARRDYLVCRYLPVGNVIGETVKTVYPAPMMRTAWMRP